MSSNPGFYRHRVGDALVTALYDGFIDLPMAALTGIEPDAAADLLGQAFRRPSPRISVNGFLVQAGGRTVLIDAGAGTAMHATLGQLAGNLAAAGVAPGDVDTVVMTHLHGDHYAGLTVDGAAVFPNAELVLPATEAGFWLDDAKAATAPDRAKANFAGVKAALAPYQGRLRSFEGTDVLPGLQAMAIPGHTPGHTGYVVASGADSLLIWGDVIHVPDIQAARPEVGLMFDIDPAVAAASRKRILDMAAADRLLVTGMHLHFPGFAHVARHGNAYALVPDTWSAEG